jgi:hypothetical protein
MIQYFKRAISGIPRRSTPWNDNSPIISDGYTKGNSEKTV